MKSKYVILSLLALSTSGVWAVHSDVGVVAGPVRGSSQKFELLEAGKEPAGEHKLFHVRRCTKIDAPVGFYHFNLLDTQATFGDLRAFIASIERKPEDLIVLMGDYLEGETLAQHAFDPMLPNKIGFIVHDNKLEKIDFNIGRLKKSIDHELQDLILLSAIYEDDIGNLERSDKSEAERNKKAKALKAKYEKDQEDVSAKILKLETDLKVLESERAALVGFGR